MGRKERLNLRRPTKKRRTHAAGNCNGRQGDQRALKGLLKGITDRVECNPEHLGIDSVGRLIWLRDEGSERRGQRERGLRGRRRRKQGLTLRCSNTQNDVPSSST